MSQAVVTLPEPQANRWQPLRSGLLNIFRYDYEEFHFDQGRLLLRGNNGTGKSRVLALQMPFLFDGEVSPHRVEPDGDPAKRIEWNLLMGRYPDRLGYTWIEFGRTDMDGGAKYVTLGIGLHAIQGRGAPARWYFVTKQRVGRDLFLQSSSGHPLPVDRLAESIGSEGQVFTTAKEYRRAVDAALFKLGEQRYRALVDLLIQLRQPQLSRDLDERKLSSVLSEALPPVSSQIITDVAESFRGLESDRRELDRFQVASDSVDAFLREYRQYARIAARRRSDGVRTHHSAYEGTQRRLKSARAEKDAAEDKLTALEGEISQLQVDEKGAIAEVETLERSPQMRSAHDLEDARRAATERLNAAEESRREHEQAVKKKQTADEEKDGAITEKDRKWVKVDEALKSASSCASAAGMQSVHQTGVSLLDLPELDDRDAVESASELLDSEALRCRDAVRHVRKLNSVVQAAKTRLSTAKQMEVQLTSLVDAAVERQREAQESLKATSEAQLKAYRAWAGKAVELAPASVDAFADQFRIWSETGSGKSPVAVAVQGALAVAQQELASGIAGKNKELQEVRGLIAEMELERTALREGRHEPPPAPYTRGAESRTAAKGAPLWTLIDFREDVSPAERAGTEAALEASGMLDAWVCPEGKLVDRATNDVFVEISSDTGLPDSSLLQILRFDPSSATDSRSVSLTVVESILAHVGLGEESGRTWVSADGSWGNGPLRGSWNKPSAQHIGQSAREARRIERLRALGAQIAAENDKAKGIGTAINVLKQRAVVAKEEADDSPQDDVVVQVLAAQTAAMGEVTRARDKAAEAEQHVNEARQSLTSAVEKRDRDAKDLSIGDWIDRLQELDDAIADYRQSLAVLWPTIREYVTVRQAAGIAENRARDAATDVARRYDLLQVAAQQAKEAVARRDTLQESVGAAVEEILGRHEKASQRVKTIRERREQAIGERGVTQGDIKAAKQKIQNEEEKLDSDAAGRADAIASLRAFVDAELLAVAAPELVSEKQEWEAVSPVVDLARSIETVMSDVVHGEVAWSRSQEGLYRHIQSLTDSLLSRELRPEATSRDGMIVVKVLFQGRNCSMPELRQALHDEVSARSTLLEKREREVLENTLIGEVAAHLHECIREGEQLVKGMNQQVESRPTSTGMRLKFSWDPDAEGPPGVLEARRRLLGTSGVWSPEEREALGSFLHRQIQNVRAANQAGTWQEHLAEALDYRKWHQFGVMRQQDGQWKRLTRQTHGTGSGGEKAVALTIPMLAAASAHYASADPKAPRLILLDEAFVGIDADMRSKCMGLLCAFDLDFIMTSEREWACYPTLPGIAIYHLTSREGIDAILTTRWVWSGRELREDAPVLPSPCPVDRQDTPLQERGGGHD